MDRLYAMTIFLAVVDEGGFAPAARKLNISPPVVTRAIGELEAAIGARLLVRSTRVVRVTDAGLRYASDCRRVLADIADIEQAANGTHAAPRGRLVITASVLFGKMYVTPIVTDYLRRYPETDIECRFLDRVLNMMDEGVDTAIRIGVLPDSSYQAVQVGQVHQLLVAAPAYLHRRGMPDRPEDLKQHAVISAIGITPTPDWRFQHDGKTQTVRVHPRMTTSSNDSAIAAALDGFGITRVLSYMVAHHLPEGRLVPLLTRFQMPPVPISVVHHEGRQSTPKIRAFIDLAIATLRADATLH
jgi:DNA-binding transcriptional LysR family regulator